MTKIAFIGAGSMNFTRCLTRDILSFPALAGSTIALMDIDRERLGYAKTAVERLIAAGRYPAKVQATLSRAEALKGAALLVRCPRALLALVEVARLLPVMLAKRRVIQSRRVVSARELEAWFQPFGYRKWMRRHLLNRGEMIVEGERDRL